MNKSFVRAVYNFTVLCVTVLLVSCGDGGGGDSAGTGTLVLGLTDSYGNYDAVYVTIAEVQVNKAAEGEENGNSGWQTPLTLDPPKTFNLLDLVNGVVAPLGEVELEAGKYNQMRLILDEKKPAEHPFANYLILTGDPEPIELKVPSGPQTGIKIVNGFIIEANQPTDLILDFDAHKSIVQAGKNRDKWLLKPTIKVLETVTYVRGTVYDSDSVNAWIEGATVSAQIYTPPPDDPPPAGWDIFNEVFVEGATVTDILGDYFIHLPLFADEESPSYNIVASMDYFMPECQEFHAINDPDNIVDFYLTAATETGTFKASVVGLPTDTDSAVFSIRKIKNCGSGEVIIEVASVEVVNTTPSYPELIYSEPIILPTLPAGETYQVVVSAAGKTTQEHDVTIVTNTEVKLDVAF